MTSELGRPKLHFFIQIQCQLTNSFESNLSTIYLTKAQKCRVHIIRLIAYSCTKRFFVTWPSLQKTRGAPKKDAQ